MANNKKISNTQEEVQASVSTIYAELLKKRKVQREEKEAKRLKEKEELKPCGGIYLTNEIRKQFEEIVGAERVSIIEE